jgi:recombination protein RecA
MSQALRKLAGSISRSRTCVVFINQIRMKIGVMFGNPETTSGGRALKFYSSVRMDIRRIGSLKVGDNVVGNRTKVKVVKNKVAPPFRVAEFDIVYGQGISLSGDLLDLGVQYGMVSQKGTWFSYGDLQLGQGRERARAFLDETADVRERLEKEIREAAGLVPRRDTADEPKSGEEATSESAGRRRSGRKTEEAGAGDSEKGAKARSSREKVAASLKK